MAYESRLSLTVDSRTGERNLRNMRGELDKTELAGSRTTAAMAKMTAAISAAAAAASGFVFTRALSKFASFEQGMRNVGAVSGSTAEELDSLSSAALQASSATRFNPEQTTQALYALASSGQNASEQMASLTNVLNLAEAGSSDLASATELTTSTLNQFNLQASESARVADVFVASIGASSLNVNRLQVAMRNAGPTAAALGQSLEGTTATLGILTTAFGNGERAGTGFRAILNELPEKAEELGVAIKDANGQFRPMVDILQDLEERGVTANRAVSEFGAEAGPALAALITQGSDALSEMESRLTSTGQAAETARSQLDTLRGDMDAFASAVDVALIEIGQSQSGILRDGIQQTTDLIRLWSGYGDTLGEAEDQTKALADGIETVGTVAALAIGAKLTGAVGTATGAFIAGQVQSVRYQAALASMAGVSRSAAVAQTTLAASARAASGAMAFLGGPLGVIALAAGSLYYFREELGLTSPEAISAAEAVDEVTSAMRDLNREEQAGFVEGLQREFSAAEAETDRLAAKLENIDVQGNQGGRAGNIIGALKRDLAEAEVEAGNLEKQLAAGTDTLKKFEQARAEAKEKEEKLAEAKEEAERRAEEARIEAARRAAEVERQAALASAEAWNDARDSAYSSFQQLMDDIDPVGAELRKLTGDIAVVQEAFARGFIDSDQADAIVNALNEAAEESREKGEQSGDNFSRGFESQVDRVADSLQNAITSGDWAGIGATVGASLASGVAQVVGDQVGQNLGSSLGAAFLGPIAGAVAGGIVGLAAAEISDWLSGSDWDPTEMRQAAQGTGTVLADMNAKSESIRRAVEGSESGIGQLVGINQNMLQALQTLQLGISGAVGMVARQRGGMEFATNNQFSQAQLAGGGLGIGIGGITTGSFGPAFGLGSEIYSFVDDALGGILSDGMEFLDNLTGGLLSSIGSSVFGGDQKIVDEGIRIIGGNLSDLVNQTLVQAYASIKEDGGWFSSDKRFDRFQNIATNQFSLAFESIYDAVAASSDALGIDASRRLGNLQIDNQRISLEGLSPEEQQAELEAVFSTIFDRAAEAAVPFIDDFQRAGEGLGETLSRVANQTLVTEEAVNRLGIRFSDLAGRELVVASERLMEAAGGVEQFISSMEGFIDNFASDAQQFALAQSDITRALSQSNLQLPATRDGYYDLLQAQNGATAAGADNIATLLRLQGVADEYYTFLEDAQQDLQRSAIESQRDMLSVQQGVYRDALQEAEAMAGSVSRALDGLSVDSQQFQAASRDRALASLERMATTGNIGSQTALDESLAAATNINAGEFGSLNDYIRTVARTGATLTNLQQITDKQVSREQQLLSNIERRLEAMTEELSAVGRASAKNTAKTAKILERIELDGLEVRE